MIRFFFILLLTILLGAIIQQWLPSFGLSWYHSRILVVPLLFYCIANATDYSSTLFYAVIAGCLWDAENILAPFSYLEEVTVEQTDNLKFGYSIFLFGSLGFCVKFLQAKLLIQGVFISTFLVFLALLTHLCLENLLIIFVRGTLNHSYFIFYQISLSAVISTCVAPLIFYVFQRIARVLNLKKCPALTFSSFFTIKLKN